MDKLAPYRQAIEKVLHTYHRPHRDGYQEYTSQMVRDHEAGHYLLLRVGWTDDVKRTHHVVFHLDLAADGKIWIQEDWTEYGTANELVDLGVPKADIILAFQAPYKRHYSGFGV